MRSLVLFRRVVGTLVPGACARSWRSRFSALTVRDQVAAERHQADENPLRGGRYAVESYLDHHGAKLVRRFDAGSYVTLTNAMNAHDVGRGRLGVSRALRRVSARTVVVGVDSDRLYPLPQQREIAAGIPGADDVRVIASPHGHDAFLVETDQVAACLNEILGVRRPTPVRGAGSAVRGSF